MAGVAQVSDVAHFKRRKICSKDKNTMIDAPSTKKNVRVNHVNVKQHTRFQYV